jgi:hypothetical protein
MNREDVRQCVQALSANRETIRQLVGNLRDDELRWKPEGQVFSCLEHVCHLRDIEREGYTLRVQKLLHEEEPFLSDIDGDKLARERNYNTQKLEFALDEFLRARQGNLSAISNLSTRQLHRRATFENYGPLTLGELLRMMVEHDHEHVRALDDLRGQLIKRRLS